MDESEAQEWRGRVGSAAKELRLLLAEGYEREAWRALNYRNWNECLMALADEFGFSGRYVQLLDAANKTQRVIEGTSNEPWFVDIIPERTLRPLTGMSDEDKREAWRVAKETAPNGRVTGSHVARVVEGLKRPGSMNRVNENIEWAAWSWNPVTGCLHNCPYCYARDIANRFYPQKFEPTFLPERLGQPSVTKPISPRWDGDTGHINVFTCSMADLFGKWVPEEWIEAVLGAIEDNPQWRFLLLTKFPIRMAEFNYPSNVWLGTTVDRQHAVHRAQTAFSKIKAAGFDGVCWLSCEPMMERLTFDSLDMFDWVVMGGASKSTQTPEYRPPFEDVIHLYDQARTAGCMVYMKTNLLRLREYPA